MHSELLTDFLCCAAVCHLRQSMAMASHLPSLKPLLAFFIAIASLSFSPSSAQNSFTYLSTTKLLTSGTVNALSDGSLLLNATTAVDAVALVASPLSIYDSNNAGLVSFTTQFTFTSNSSVGILGFVVVGNASISSLEGARVNGLTVELSTACGGATEFNDTSEYYYGSGRYGRRGGRYGGYGPGGAGRFGTVEYVNGTPYGPLLPAWTYNGTNWARNSSTPDNGNCTLPNPNSYPAYLFDVIIQYNASSSTLLVGSPTCSVGPHVYNFSAAAIAGSFSADPYIGLIASAGGVYNVSQWNFTTNGTDAFTSLSMVVSGGSGSGSGSGINDGGSGSGFGGRGGSGGGGLSRGAKIGIGVGVAIAGVALIAAFCVCCCFGRRRRAETTHGVIMKGVPPPVSSGKAMVFGVQKTSTVVVTEKERDTTPLTRSSSTSSTTTTTTTATASWLPPVVPR